MRRRITARAAYTPPRCVMRTMVRGRAQHRIAWERAWAQLAEEYGLDKAITPPPWPRRATAAAQ